MRKKHCSIINLSLFIYRCAEPTDNSRDFLGLAQQDMERLLFNITDVEGNI